MKVKCLCWNCGREIYSTESVHEINEELWCDECEKYKAWKKEWDELKEKERIYNDMQRIFRRKF